VDFDIQVKLAIYQHIAETTQAPSVDEVAERTGASPVDVREAYGRLARNRVLVLQPDGVSIRMAPPFSGVPTQHRVEVGGREYFANCAWDALGVVAALHREGEILSRCEQTFEPINFQVRASGPEPEPCVIHFAVPAAHWWKDIVFT
jgi:hypothetical protein